MMLLKIKFAKFFSLFYSIRMRRFLSEAITILVSLLTLAIYILFINPLFVKITNISNIDRRELIPKIQSVADQLLNKNFNYRTTETLTSDLKTVEILQNRVGIKSAAELHETKIPSQFLRRDYYLRDKYIPVNASSENPIVSIEIDPYGVISFLKFSSENSLLPAEIPSIIQKLFSILELDPKTIEQLSPEDIKNEELEEIKFREEYESFSKGGKFYREILYRQKIEGVPLASYIYRFNIGEKDVIYQRDIAFKKSFIGEPKSPVRDIFQFLIWFAAGFFSLAVLIVKIRRDEIDWVLLIKVMLFAALVSFLMLIFKEPFSLFLTFLIAILSFAIGLFFALIFALSESKTRELCPEHLSVFDAIFQGHFKIKELGKMILWCFVYGNIFFLIQELIIFIPAFNKNISTVVLPPDPLNFKTSFPLSLLIGNIVSPAIFASFSLLFFGVLSPVFLQRADKKWIKFLTVLFFTVIVCCHSKFAPFVLCFLLFCLTIPIQLRVWKNFGFLGIFFCIWFPLTLQNGLLLFMAKDVSVAIEGLLILLVVSALVISSLFLSYKGKPVSQIKTYEPLYLKRLREKERFERELEIAKHLQQKLLPQNAPKLGNIEFGSLCEPALSVGGDYFDFLEPCEGKLFVFLGDVSGKGMRAAFYMTLAKGLLHGSFNLVNDHRELLTILNKRFGTLAEEGVFLTLIMLTVNCRTREILITSAGHNSPLLYKDGEISIVPSRGLVVGPMPEEMLLNSLQEFKFTLNKGDILLLYTDGVTEAMNPFLEEYGIDRLKSVFANSVELSAEEIVTKIRLSVLDFVAGSPLSDDLTVLVLKGLDDNSK